MPYQGIWWAVWSRNQTSRDCTGRRFCWVGLQATLVILGESFFSFQLFFMVVKCTWQEIWHLNRFWVHRSVAISTFVMLCSHHHHPSQEGCHLAKLKLFPVEAQPLTPLPSPWTPPWYFQSLKLTLLLLFFSHQVVSGSLWPHGLQQIRLLCPSLSPIVRQFMSIELVMC